MTAPVAWLSSLGLFVALALVGAVQLQVLFPSVTARLLARRTRRALLGALGAITGAHAAWALDAGRLSRAGMVVSCVAVVILGFVVASLVPAAAVHRVMKVLLLRRPGGGAARNREHGNDLALPSPRLQGATITRRRLVSAAAAMVPAASVATALRGFAAGKVDDVSCPRLRLDVASLPARA
jgi:hypothetical protein